jgi:hypothetical protein
LLENMHERRIRRIKVGSAWGNRVEAKGCLETRKKERNGQHIPVRNMVSILGLEDAPATHESPAKKPESTNPPCRMSRVIKTRTPSLELVRETRSGEPTRSTSQYYNTRIMESLPWNLKEATDRQ